MNDILEYGKEDVLNFIQTTIKNNNNVKNDILDKIKYVLGPVIEGPVIEGDVIEDYSSQGFYYERLWDLCIKFGATNLTLPAIKGKLQTSHIINENPNKDTGIDFQSNCWDGNKLDKNPGGYLLQPVRSGNSGGYSDITFLNQKLHEKGNKKGEEELYFISVKYYRKEKGISDYDIGKLCTLIRAHDKENRIIKLYIFVNNKKEAIEKFKEQKSSSNILIKYINPGGNYEHILDINDLQEAFFKLKKILEQYDYLQSPKNINDFQSNYLNVLKDVFIPRFHQELFILKINNLIENGEKNVLVGAIPRSGKSYIIAGTILEYVKKQEELHPGKKVKFLLITPAPNETFGEYENIFNNYIEFDKLGIDVVTYKDGIDSKKICKNKDKHCVIIISKQKLGWSAGSNAEKILAKDDKVVEGDVEDDVELEEVEDEVKDENDKNIKTIKQRVINLFHTIPDIDIMFLDEAHFGMSTEKAQQIVNVLDSAISNTTKIYVTATYNKPLQAYGVKAECKLTWDMNDIQIMQKIDEKTITNNSIQKQFGHDIYVKALEYFGDKTGISLIDKFKNDYAIFPKPYLITSVWDKEFLNVEKLKIGDSEFGWDMNTLFVTIGDSDNFANEEAIKEMMRYYFGYPDKDKNYDKQSFYRTRGILPRIRNICLNKCRTLQPQHKTTQLWFLPLGNGKIKNKTKALVNLLTNSNEFKDIKQNYHFFIAVDIEDKTKKGRTTENITYMGDPHNIKADIEKVEKAIKEGKIKKDNLIILAGQRLQLGISLRNVDIVTLWNSISSADAIFQMLFRSMTEVDAPLCKPKEYCDEKKFGFMVDMNPQRSLTNVSLFSANISKKKDADNIQNYRQITDLINIDEDVLYDKYGDDEKSRNEFVNDLFNKLYASWNINVENIKKIIGKFTFNMARLEEMKKAFQEINIEKNKKTKDEIDAKEEDEMIDPGKKKEKIGKTTKKDKKKIIEKEINLIETATELISEFISLLNIFTLYADKGAQCILSDSSNSNTQITVIDDIDILKSSVYQDEEKKDVFLKILNGRLSGNADEPYPENVIDDVLDAMDSLNDKLIVNKIIMSQKKHYYTINEPDKLLKYINDELEPKEKEKKENGEVFTDLSLVNEMLDKLDEAYIKEHGKSIFTEDGFKWLDPAVGIGNFPIIVYQRLMNGLVTKIPNEEERRKHILEQMIYSAELTPKNVFIYKKIFCGDKYKLNIYEGDTLKMDVKKEFKLHADFDGFDVVMGNPPFQGTGRKKLYINFIKNIITTKLKEDGYLLFITPKLSLLYLLGSNISQQTISKLYNIPYINTSDTIKNKYFKDIGSDFMYFILQNNVDYDKTTFIFDDDTIDNTLILKFNSILDTKTKPNNSNINNIINKLIKINSNEWKRKAARISDNLQDTKDATHINKIIYKIKTDPKNDEIKWTSKTHPDMYKYKILYPTLGTRILIDSNKNLFPGTSFVLYIICNSLNECENIKVLMNSKIFKYLENIFKTQRSPRDYVMKNLIKPSNFDIEINNDEDIYKYFSLTKKEIYEIEHFLKKDNMEDDISDAEGMDNGDISKAEGRDDGDISKAEGRDDGDISKAEGRDDGDISKAEGRDDGDISKAEGRDDGDISEAEGAEEVVEDKPPKKSPIKLDKQLIDTNSEKIFNPLTKRYIKNTLANRKKIAQQILKQGGNSKKRSRKKIEQRTLKRGRKSKKKKTRKK